MTRRVGRDPERGAQGTLGMAAALVDGSQGGGAEEQPAQTSEECHG